LTKPVLLRRAAELDLVAIEDCYDSQRQGLGREFREAVDAAIARISDWRIRSVTEGPAVPFYDASPTSSGTARLRTSWSFSRAFMAGAIPVSFALGFAEAANCRQTSSH